MTIRDMFLIRLMQYKRIWAPDIAAGCPGPINNHLLEKPFATIDNRTEPS